MKQSVRCNVAYCSRVQYAMSRGAVQGGRELRLRVRHKKPKRLLRSWYNLIGQEQAAPNGVDTLDEIHKDLKHHSNNSHTLKEAAVSGANTAASLHSLLAVCTLQYFSCFAAVKRREAQIEQPRHERAGRFSVVQVVNENKHRGSSQELKEPVSCKRSILNTRWCVSHVISVLKNPTYAGAKIAVEPSCEGESEHDDRDLVCSVCTMGDSDPPNEIVICDTCNKARTQDYLQEQRLQMAGLCCARPL
ncbi:hypothetical protein HPB48_001370 [Haemaphysalis longicornis]|uniref:Uncharacterized protein n=1 Tax=Haemaphysalis longicornis TaxID=44386 RepID=A0A9J6FGL6_HAELO|nr:hypothetical protein HPB48_001370 [Haemaphysalis longicornis]